LEYAYDDWCVAQMAKSLGKMEDYHYFMTRSQYYKNVFDPSTKYVRAKYKGGPWLAEFTPIISAVGKEDNFGTKDYVEGNAWQFSWFVPHDLAGLIDLMGIDEFNNRLVKGFEAARPNFVSEFVNHSNQPNMQAPYLFNYSGKPWLTQKWVREIIDHYYGTGPVDGYPGDEDQGQMGAWFVMSAMGLFQMDGGASIRPIYELGSPIFEKIIIQLDDKYYKGGQFVIKAKNTSSKNRYIQSATLNGKSLDTFWFYHDQVVNGGELILEMGPSANKKWASNGMIPKQTDYERIVTTPYVDIADKLFLDEIEVSLACDTEGAEIYYTLDNSDPKKSSQLYDKPFFIRNSTDIKMRAYLGNQASLMATAKIRKAQLQDPIESEMVQPGIIYKYFSGSFRNVFDFSELKSQKSAVIDIFSIQPRESEQYFAFDFNGYIQIPRDGLYTFYLRSNDGSRMYLNDRLLINNDGLHPVVERFKSIALKKGLHPISVKYFQEGGTHDLRLSWKGPGFEKQEIPASVLFHEKI
jgi:hypothetical protein